MSPPRKPPTTLPTVETIIPSKAGGRHEYRSGPLWLILDQPTPTGIGLHAWVEARWDLGPTDMRLLHAARHDLMASRTTGAIVAAITQSLPDLRNTVDWAGIITASTYLTVHQHLEGNPPRIAHPHLRPPEDAWLIRGLWRNAQATSLTGLGGSGKSFLAQAAALTVTTGRATPLGLPCHQPGPALYVDYEGDPAEFDHRYQQLLTGSHLTDPGNLHHLKPRAPLHRLTPTLQRHIDQEGIVALIVDSVGYARGGEQAGDNQASTMALYQTIEELDRPTLLIDHRAKHADQLDPTPIGAVANYNSLRLLWLVTSVRTSTGRSFRLHCAKNNYGPDPDDTAWDLAFTPDNTACTLTPRNPGTVANLEDQTQAERAWRALLDHGPQGATTRQLAADTGIPTTSIRTVLNRMRDEGTARRDGNTWIALAADDQTALPDGDEAPF